MKPFFPFSSAAIVACALVVARPVEARDTVAQSAARRAIAAGYQTQNQAMIRKDIPAMMSTLAPDYVQHDQTYGQLDRARTETMLRASLADPAPGFSMRYTSASTKFLSLTWRGPDAIVISQTTAVAVARGAGRSIRVEGVSVARDYWSPTPSGWKIRQSVERETKMWRDGKRIR